MTKTVSVVSAVLLTTAFASLVSRASVGDDATAAPRPVAAKLKEMSSGVEKKAPEAAKIFADGVAAVAASGIVEKAHKVGDKAEPFELPDATGKKVKLADLLAKGPVVVTWYRGGWCPYCNIGLQGLLEVEPQIREHGATLVAISPETPESAADTVEKNKLTFAVLSDKHNETARKYGIAYKIPAKASATMKSFKVDLEKRNGDASDELPLGATYVIDKDGVIRWSFVDADYRKRAEPADVLAALKKLQK
jgi:peroxiredoxin